MGKPKEELGQVPLNAATSATGTTTSACYWPIIGAVKAADLLIGAGIDWHSVNEHQKGFLETVYNRFGGISLPEVQSKALYVVAEINAWLKSKGFDIQLDDNLGEGGFATASILDLLVEWLNEGKVTAVRDHLTQQQYPGVFLDGGVSFRKVANHPHPIVVVRTKTNDVVNMMMVDRHLDEEDLHTIVEGFKSAEPCYDFKGLIFPMVSLNHQVDISWLCGMWREAKDSDGRKAIIAQALQQTKLRMNEFGARVESAVALGMARSCCFKPPHVIDRPFLCWFERPGLELPLAVFWLAQDSWKNPGSLK